MTHTATTPSVTSHFDAAKAIVDKLAGLEKPAQILAIRFACETLALSIPGLTLTSPPMGGAGGGGGGGTTDEQSNRTDLKQFTASKSPKSDQQFTAVVAYYYRFVVPENKRRDTIDAELMESAARGVWQQKSRWGMTLTNAKNAGYLDPAGTGLFRLSAIGENLVAMTLGQSGSSTTGGVTPTPRKNAAKKKTKRRSKKP